MLSMTWLFVIGCALTSYGTHAQSCGEVTISSGSCSYTVAAGGSGGSSSSGSCADCAGLENAIESQTGNIASLTNRVVTLENQDPPECDCPASSGGSGNAGTTYVRWGRTECGDTAELVYPGYAAKSHYTQAGGGVNFQCLPEEPEFLDSVQERSQSGALIYGVEYQHQGSPVWPTSVHDHNVPCAVCSVTGRSRLLMIPAKITCPDGWTEEYGGFLVAAHHSHQASTFECLDGEPEHIPGGGANTDGGLMYIVEAMGPTLSSPPYTEGYELSCVVCTA